MLAIANVQTIPVKAGSIGMIYTDPPYLKSYLHTYEWLANEAARVLKVGGFVLAMCGGQDINKIFRFFDDAGLTFFWEFSLSLPHHGGFVWRHSDKGNKGVTVSSKRILAYSKGRAVPRCNMQSDFLMGAKDKRYHHWGQDVASARYFIDCMSNADDIVLDPFVGGGSTVKACQLLGRRWIGFDVDPSAIVATQNHLADKPAMVNGRLDILDLKKVTG